MVRAPKSKEQDAWKRWLLGGAKLFDRTWSGWALLYWLFSFAVVYVAYSAHHLLAVVCIVAMSAMTFGLHIAVFDVLASGKRSPLLWLAALANDISLHKTKYLHAAIVRSITVCASLFLLGALMKGYDALSAFPSTPKIPTEQPLWKFWGVWAWMWLIPAGWQKCGALGWGHWLVRRENISIETAEDLAKRGVSANLRSYLYVIACLMIPGMAILIFFPPLLPIWDLYAAAVCWCIWDDVFGEGDGLKQQEAKKVATKSAIAVGA